MCVDISVIYSAKKGKIMGYSVEILAVINLLSRKKLFSDIKSVVDLGSQEMHFSEIDTNSFPYREIIRSTIKSASGQEITDEELSKFSNRQTTGEFYKFLGKGYKALDADGWFNNPFDLNFDQTSKEDKGAYCLAVNAGTTEHLIDQLNACRVMHDLTRTNGFILHVLPFTGGIDHGFFNYHPNFFEAQAHFNDYEILGLWVIAMGMTTLIPWNKNTARYMDIFKDKDTSIICLFRKKYDLEYCTPFQKGYETAQAASNLARYNYVVDGNLISGVDALRAKNSTEHLSFKELLSATQERFFKRLRTKIFG